MTGNHWQHLQKQHQNSHSHQHQLVIVVVVFMVMADRHTAKLESTKLQDRFFLSALT